MALQKVLTLEELNHHLDNWISEHYHKSPHYGLGGISFDGRKYEVGLQLIGRKVGVYYDPAWKDEVEIHHKDFPSSGLRFYR